MIKNNNTTATDKVGSVESPNSRTAIIV